MLKSASSENTLNSLILKFKKKNLLQYIFSIKNIFEENSLVVHWLGLRVSTAEDTSLILGWETEILYAMWCGQ